MMLSQGNSYFENNKVCQNCGQKMKQRFVGLKHCRCGMSQIKNPPGIVAIQPGGFFGAVIRQTLVTSVKIEKSQETKEHDDVKVIIVLVPRG